MHHDVTSNIQMVATIAWKCNFGDEFGDHFGDDLRIHLWNDLQSATQWMEPGKDLDVLLALVSPRCLPANLDISFTPEWTLFDLWSYKPPLKNTNIEAFDVWCIKTSRTYIYTKGYGCMHTVKFINKILPSFQVISMYGTDVTGLTKWKSENKTTTKMFTSITKTNECQPQQLGYKKML